MPKKKLDQALAEELDKLLTDADTALKDRIALRDAVCAYYDGEKANGVPLERILMSVTEMLDRAEERVTGVEGQNGMHELAQQLIDWCVELDGGRGARGERRGN